MRCLGRKKTTRFRRRCTNEVRWWMPFCWRHRFQMALAMGTLIGVGVGVGEFSGLSLRGLSRYMASASLIVEAIGNSQLESDEESCVAFSLRFIDRPSIVHLPLVIRNMSSKRVSNVTVNLVLSSDYVHVLPAHDANSLDAMGALSPDDCERTTSHAGLLSFTTIRLPGLDGQATMMLVEPLVWTPECLAQIRAGHAPIVDLNIRMSADETPRSAFKLQLQAVQNISTGDGRPAHAPVPFSDVSRRIIVVSSEMGEGVYQGKPCYLAKGLTTRDVVLKRGDR